MIFDTLSVTGILAALATGVFVLVSARGNRNDK
jgi:hypothetical protein